MIQEELDTVRNCIQIIRDCMEYTRYNDPHESKIELETQRDIVRILELEYGIKS